MPDYENHTIKGVLNVAFPLIISCLSSGIMIMFDRIMLARFDINIMNAVVFMGLLLFLLDWSISSITITTEVFSGQYNGLNKNSMVPVASWQMLFFSCIAIVFYIPIGLYLGQYIIPKTYYESSGNFFKIAICFMAISPAIGSLNGFFVGIKKTKIILINSIIGNIINIILSYNLIFGIDGFISPLGAAGAAIATTISLSIQFFVIFYFFISKEYHNKYNTRNYHFNKVIFTKCLKLGIPSSAGFISEDIANYVLQIIIINKIPEYVSNNNIGVNLCIFIFFLLWGIQKAIGGLAANIIGENKLELIPKLLKSSLQIHFICSFIILFFFTFFSKNIAKLYTNDAIIIYYTKYTLPWVGLYYLVAGIGWIISGILTSGGDTKFVMIITIFSGWLLKLVPTYVLLSIGVKHFAIGWMITTISSIVFTVVLYCRFKSGKWLRLKLT